MSGSFLSAPLKNNPPLFFSFLRFVTKKKFISFQDEESLSWGCFISFHWKRKNKRRQTWNKQNRYKWWIYSTEISLLMNNDWVSMFFFVEFLLFNVSLNDADVHQYKTESWARISIRYLKLNLIAYVHEFRPNFSNYFVTSIQSIII